MLSRLVLAASVEKCLPIIAECYQPGTSVQPASITPQMTRSRVVRMCMHKSLLSSSHMTSKAVQSKSRLDCKIAVIVR
jgi:hypothetical protein